MPPKKKIPNEEPNYKRYLFYLYRNDVNNSQWSDADLEKLPKDMKERLKNESDSKKRGTCLYEYLMQNDLKELPDVAKVLKATGREELGESISTINTVSPQVGKKLKPHIQHLIEKKTGAFNEANTPLKQLEHLIAMYAAFREEMKSNQVKKEMQKIIDQLNKLIKEHETQLAEMKQNLEKEREGRQKEEKEKEKYQRKLLKLRRKFVEVQETINEAVEEMSSLIQDPKRQVSGLSGATGYTDFGYDSAEEDSD